MPLPRITHKRRFVQALLIAAALLLPFATISGNPFLRMDIATMTLFLGGVPLRIDQFCGICRTEACRNFCSAPGRGAG